MTKNIKQTILKVKLKICFSEKKSIQGNHGTLPNTIYKSKFKMDSRLYVKTYKYFTI